MQRDCSDCRGKRFMCAGGITRMGEHGTVTLQVSNFPAVEAHTQIGRRRCSCGSRLSTYLTTHRSLVRCRWTETSATWARHLGTWSARPRRAWPSWDSSFSSRLSGSRSFAPGRAGVHGPGDGWLLEFLLQLSAEWPATQVSSRWSFEPTLDPRESASSCPCARRSVSAAR